MQDWKIALMVIICVVFAVLAMILIFLIHRYWNGEPRGPCCGCWGSSDKYAVGRYGRSSDEDERGDSGPVPCYPGCHPSRDTLYFLDFEQTLHAIQVRRKHITDGAALQRAIAQAARVTDNIHTLSLAATAASSGLGSHVVGGGAYRVGDATVELDLDRLVARDAEFGARMEQTAERPLLLHRLVEVDMPGAPLSTATARGAATAGGDSPPAALVNPFGSASASANLIDVSIERHQQQQQQQRGNWIEPSQPSWLVGDADHNGSCGSFRKDRGTGSVGLSHLQGIFQDPTPPVPLPSAAAVPTPILFPSNTSHVTASTPVFVMAAHYYICYPGVGIGSGQVQLLDEATTALLEAAMCGQSSSRSVFMISGPFRGATFVVNPRTGTATYNPAAVDLYHTHNHSGTGGGGAIPVVRRGADVIRYCIDNNDGSQWRSFKQPIFLPPGQWCLRAKASSNDDKFTKTAAKVFYVSVSTTA